MDRIVTAAAEAGLGDLQGSHRANSHFEHDIVGVGCLLLGSAALLFAGTFWLPDAGLHIAVAVMTIIGVSTVLIGLPQYRRGRWLVHEFEHGLVMERAKGRLIAARYGDVRAELRTYRTPETAESPAVDHVLIRLGFPDGRSYVMAEPKHDAPEVLMRLGGRCGADDPQPIDHKVAADLVREHPWV